jgi:plasmid stabilization system protein ParE
MEDRRTFVLKAAALMTGTGMLTASGRANTVQSRNVFVHHVFFWLKEPQNVDVRKDFEKGLSELIKVPQIQFSHIGTPVESPREVVDDSFTYSYMVFFGSREDQNIYQTHAIHLKFVEECQHLWKKVIVYDSID